MSDLNPSIPDTTHVCADCWASAPLDAPIVHALTCPRRTSSPMTLETCAVDHPSHDGLHAATPECHRYATDDARIPADMRDAYAAAVAAAAPALTPRADDTTRAAVRALTARAREARMRDLETALVALSAVLADDTAPVLAWHHVGTLDASGVTGDLEVPATALSLADLEGRNATVSDGTVWTGRTVGASSGGLQVRDHQGAGTFTVRRSELTVRFGL